MTERGCLKGSRLEADYSRNSTSRLATVCRTQDTDQGVHKHYVFIVLANYSDKISKINI